MPVSGILGTDSSGEGRRTGMSPCLSPKASMDSPLIFCILQTPGGTGIFSKNATARAGVSRTRNNTAKPQRYQVLVAAKFVGSLS